MSSVKVKLGLIPNMTRVMANSPAVLEGYLGLSGALSAGLLKPKVREELALVVAQDNECDYCLPAHTAIGKLVGLTPEEIAINESDLASVRAAGFSDAEVAEIIAHVALNVLTNYFNKSAGVDIDFPTVSFRIAN